VSTRACGDGLSGASKAQPNTPTPAAWPNCALSPRRRGGASSCGSCLRTALTGRRSVSYCYCFSSGVVVGQPSRVEDWTAGRKAGAPRGLVFGCERVRNPFSRCRGVIVVSVRRELERTNDLWPNEARNKRKNIGINQLERSLAFIRSHIKTCIHFVVSNIHPSSSVYQTFIHPALVSNIHSAV
jgi:hypothetical protein